MATQCENAGDKSINEPVLTNHEQVVGSCTGCFKVHDKDHSPYLLGVSLAKSVYYHTEMGLWMWSQSGIKY